MIIAIDPGLTGAIAVMDHYGDRINIQDLPTIAHGKSTKVRRQIDPANLADIIKKNQFIATPTVVVMEAQHPRPGQGVSSVFSLGDSNGVIRGVTASLEIPLHQISPAKWKKALGLNSDKEISRSTAIKLYPAFSHLLARKRDHNRAEALLLAHYWLTWQFFNTTGNKST